MELLNSFDCVVTEQRVKADVANQVYRNLLKRGREKAYQQLEHISKEISDLEGKFYTYHTIGEESEEQKIVLREEVPVHFTFQDSFCEEPIK